MLPVPVHAEGEAGAVPPIALHDATYSPRKHDTSNPSKSQTRNRACWLVHLISRQVLHHSMPRAELGLVACDPVQPACCPVQAELPIPVEACTAKIGLAACPQLLLGPAAHLAMGVASRELLAGMQHHGQLQCGPCMAATRCPFCQHPHACRGKLGKKKVHSWPQGGTHSPRLAGTSL